jgi:hypothetical protein
MIKQRLTRRQFFQASALGAGALALPAIGLASVAAAPSLEAQAAAEQPEALLAMQPTFSPIASTTTFGPLTDISMGWDGTQWGIDGQGAPHIYDAINDAWVQHGDGIDAAAQLGALLYLFRGDSLVIATQGTTQIGAPVSIAQQWPTLPDSFKLSVIGAANFNDKGLILFNGGRFVSTDGSIPLTSLTSLTNWPLAWKDGVIDAVYCSAVNQPVVLVRNGQFIGIDPVAKTVTSQPAPLSTLAPLNAMFPADWLTSGFDAGTVAGLYQIAFKGTAMAIQQNGAPSAAQPLYIASFFNTYFNNNWPPTWHPQLQHAPSGRDGNLWSVLPSALGSWIMRHNGQAWFRFPNQADSVGAGQDDTVMIASQGRLWRFNGRTDGTGFDPRSASSELIQVSVGDENNVYARDVNDAVFKWDAQTNALTPSNVVGAATHVSATSDGTLWHVKRDSADTYRYLAGQDILAPILPVKANLVTSVQQVAASAFGAALCLVKEGGATAAEAAPTRAYKYDSPYAFMSDKIYEVESNAIAQGDGRLYVSDSDSLEVRVSAIDAHTGRAISVALTIPYVMQVHFGTPLFDPDLNLIYIATRNRDEYESPTGTLYALDADDPSRVVWSYATPLAIDGTPALVDGILLFGDRAGNLYAFDTAATFANPTQPAPKSVWTPGAVLAFGGRSAFTPPMLVNGRYFTIMWLGPTRPSSEQSYDGYRVSIDPASGGGTDGIEIKHLHQSKRTEFGPDLRALASKPVVAKFASHASGGVEADHVFIHGGDALLALYPDSSVATFRLPGTSTIASGLTWDADAKQVWFGGTNGTLYGLDDKLRHVGHSPLVVGGSNNSIRSTPILYKNVQGNKAIFFGMTEGVALSRLFAFDPNLGNVSTVNVGTTQINSLSLNATNGVLFAGGKMSGIGEVKPGQVFCLRVDRLTQGLRDFIIESQLMQDPDPAAAKTGKPPSVARYQTHLTVVDEQKIPLPREAIKIWADAPDTVLQIDGKRYTVGPGDGQFALVSTGVDGAVVITSDATDINASALRVWAGFMNPNERIMVYPDREWHARLLRSQADGGDAGTPNLGAARTYDGKPLFTDEQKSQNAPGALADAIRQINAGVSSYDTTVSVASNLRTLHASNPAAPYIAYPDLHGMHYVPNNARAARTLQTAQAVGLGLRVEASGQLSPVTLTPEAARDAIDAMTGTPLNPAMFSRVAADASNVQSSRDIFSDFWDWLKRGLEQGWAAIKQFFVSVWEGVQVAFELIVDGLTYVFKPILDLIEDVVEVVVAMFLVLVAAIIKLLEALGVDFGFGEITWTQSWLKQQINSTMAAAKERIVDTIVPAVDGYFKQGESAIRDAFKKLRDQLAPGQSIDDWQGGRSTAHTALTVETPDGEKSSLAVQGAWAAQKMKSDLDSIGAKQARARALAQAAPAQGETAPAQMDGSQSQNPLEAFIDGFVARITNDGDLSATFDQLGVDFDRLFETSSLDEFLTQTMIVLLDLVETFLIGALAIGNAIIDGILNIAASLIDSVINILNADLGEDLPLIKWLWEIFVPDQKFTILNALTFVTAIPVTMIYHAAYNRYPSQDLGGSSVAVASGSSAPNGANVVSAEITRATLVLQGMALGLLGLVIGILRALKDANPAPVGVSVPGVEVLRFAFTGAYTFIGLPTLSQTKPEAAAWVNWGLSFVSWVILGAKTFLSSPFGPGNLGSKIKFFIDWETHISCVFGLLRLIVTSALFTEQEKNDLNNTSFARTLFTLIPAILGPLRKLPGQAGVIGAAVVVAADVISGFAVLICSIILGAITPVTFSAPQPQPRIRRLFFPFVPHNPAVAQAHPLALVGATP